MDPRQYPDKWGRFGQFGGKYAPEVLMPALEELETHYLALRENPAFLAELDLHLKEFVGRPSPLDFAERMTQKCGGAKKAAAMTKAASGKGPSGSPGVCT